jgi:hypothetical protein
MMLWYSATPSNGDYNNKSAMPSDAETMNCKVDTPLAAPKMAKTFAEATS